MPVEDSFNSVESKKLLYKQGHTRNALTGSKHYVINPLFGSYYKFSCIFPQTLVNEPR